MASVSGLWLPPPHWFPRQLNQPPTLVCCERRRLLSGCSGGRSRSNWCECNVPGSAGAAPSHLERRKLTRWLWLRRSRYRRSRYRHCTSGCYCFHGSRRSSDLLAVTLQQHYHTRTALPSSSSSLWSVLSLGQGTGGTPASAATEAPVQCSTPAVSAAAAPQWQARRRPGSLLLTLRRDNLRSCLSDRTVWACRATGCRATRVCAEALSDLP